jgi:hypothetical protein
MRIKKTREAARSGRLECEFEEECHPAVALVSIVTREGLARCSGVLVSEDEVLTNDHCVKRALSLEAKAESLEEVAVEPGDLVFSFSPTEKSPEGVQATGALLRKRSGEKGIMSVDYARVKLDRKITDRPPVKVAGSGLRDGEPVVIHRVQMSGAGNYGGVQGRLACEADHGTYVYPTVRESRSPLMTFGDCVIQSGNSGSPVLNAAGELVAIIQGYLVLRSDAEAYREIEPYLLEGHYGSTGLATQVYCLLGDSPEPCLDLPPQVSLSPSQFLAAFGVFDEGRLPALENGWKWGEVPGKDPLWKLFRSRPSCARDERFSAEELRVRKGLDPKLRIAYRLEAATSEKPEFVRQSGTSDPVVYSNPTLGGIRLPVCRN